MTGNATARTRTESRGVSDLVGYVLMVAVILVGVGLTATVGVDAIDQARMNQQTQSAERGMELIDGHVDDLQQSQAAVRSTELALGRGQLSVNGSDARSAITVNVSGTGDSPTRYSMGALTYRHGDAVVAFEGGGVFHRSPRGNPVAAAEPTLLCDDDRALVSLVSLQGRALGHSYGGDVTLVLREHNSSVLFPVNRTGAESQAEATGVNVTIHSEHASAWNETLRDGSQWQASSDPAGPRLRCAPADGTVYVRRTVINVTARR
jgi:FlaG/FlaF family flagellin (archaellin)